MGWEAWSVPSSAAASMKCPAERSPHLYLSGTGLESVLYIKSPAIPTTSPSLWFLHGSPANQEPPMWARLAWALAEVIVGSPAGALPGQGPKEQILRALSQYCV